MGPEYANQPLIDFEVYRQGEAQPTIVSINESLRMSHLKNMLSSIFRVHKSRLVLRSYVTKRVCDDFYDYYLTSFKQLNNNTILVEIKESEVAMKETPRFILSNSGIFKQLQALLRATNEEIADLAWTLLLALPVNEESKEKLARLDVGGETLQDWERYLGISDSSVLAYYLHVMSGMCAAGTENSEKFMERFVSKGGLTFLLSSFAKSKTEARTKLNTKCLEYTIRLITGHLRANTYAILFPKPESDISLWNDVLEITEWSRGKPALDAETEFALFDACCGFHSAMAKANDKFVEMGLRKGYLEILKKCTSHSGTPDRLFQHDEWTDPGLDQKGAAQPSGHPAGYPEQRGSAERVLQRADDRLLLSRT